MIISSYITYMFLLPFSVVYLLLILSFFENIDGSVDAKIGSGTGKKNIVKIRDAALVASALDIAALIEEFDSYISYGDSGLLFESYHARGLLIPTLILAFHVFFFIFIVKYDIDGKLNRKEIFPASNLKKYMIIDKIINIYIAFGLVSTNALTMQYVYGVLQ